MELQTISQVSKLYDISARMLRYYEQIGLIQSIRNDGNAYRYYDNAAIKRIQQIVILRKLQIPVNKICVILNNPNAETVINIFKENISELDSEIMALSTIKNILNGFVNELEKISDLQLNLDFLGKNSVLELASSLSLIQKNTKENITIAELNKANETLSKKNQLKIFTFKTQLDEFLFLGFEQEVTSDSDFGKVWDNYFKTAEKVDFGNYEQIIWYYKDNKQIYFVGKIVENADVVPEGFSLVKFPACEYLVVTHEWTENLHDGIFLTQEYIGIGQTHDYKGNIPMLDGYVRYDDPDSPITQIEIENSKKQFGGRFERWIPIKKVEE